MAANSVTNTSIGTNRIARAKTTGGGVVRKSGLRARVEGKLAVDLIPRLDERNFDDGESKGLALLVGPDEKEEFVQGEFVSDLERTLVFVRGQGGGAWEGGREATDRCARILMEEVEKARDVAEHRKVVPRT
jgi:hypothetical protein